MPANSESASPIVYQLQGVLHGVSPLIWRRLLVREDTTIAGLQAILQLCFGWSGEHLHRFVIHGRGCGISYAGGVGFRDDPRRVRLGELGLRHTERFTYHYDFTRRVVGGRDRREKVAGAQHMRLVVGGHWRRTVRVTARWADHDPALLGRDPAGRPRRIHRAGRVAAADQSAAARPDFQYRCWARKCQAPAFVETDLVGFCAYQDRVGLGV